MSFLPDGLELVAADEQPIPVKICQADPSGPAFVVHVKRLSPVELKSVVAAFNARVGGQKAKPSREQIARDDRLWGERFSKKVIDGWDGLTIPNFQLLDRSKTKVAGDVKGAVAKGVTIPFSIDAAVHLMTNAWPEDFSDLIFAAVKNGAEEVAEEEEGKPESSEATA